MGLVQQMPSPFWRRFKKKGRKCYCVDWMINDFKSYTTHNMTTCRVKGELWCFITFFPQQPWFIWTFYLFSCSIGAPVTRKIIKWFRQIGKSQLSHAVVTYNRPIHPFCLPCSQASRVETLVLKDTFSSAGHLTLLDPEMEVWRINVRPKGTQDQVCHCSGLVNTSLNMPIWGAWVITCQL